MTNARILIVDDDEDAAAHLEECLKSLGYTVCAALSSGRRALERAGAARPDLALVDLGLEGELKGAETGKLIGRRFGVPVVYLTDEAGGELLRRARATGPCGYLLRPFAEGQLHLNIQAALCGHERERRQGEARARLRRNVDKLKDLVQLMNTVFDSISDGVVVANAKGEFLYVNPAAEQIVGMGATDAAQKEWAERYGTYHPDRETPMKTEDLPLIRAIHRGESVDEEDLFIRNPKRPDGVYIRVSARPLLDKIGGIRGGVIIFRDVTERLLAEEALARAFAQGRLEIVETILHNIGNAINSVTTGIETVRRNLLNDPVGRRLFVLAAAVREHREDWLDYIANDPQGRKVMPFIVELAEGSSRRNEDLMKTVDRVRDRANHIADIVRTQKARAGSGMDRKDVDLHDALAGAVRVLRDSLHKRGIRVAIECDGAPQQIRIEESQFHQMLVNLVKNSLEAIDDLAAAQGLDEAPRIRIRASAGEEFLDLAVADNGIGIGNKDTRVLFSPGYTTKESGSGLGLHSAANFVIGLGGRIQPSSEGTGKGTTMRVTLPLSAVAPHAGAGERRQ